jgi:hypothetical protein
MCQKPQIPKPGATFCTIDGNCAGCCETLPTCNPAVTCNPGYEPAPPNTLCEGLTSCTSCCVQKKCPAQCPTGEVGLCAVCLPATEVRTVSVSTCCIASSLFFSYMHLNCSLAYRHGE